MAENSLNTLAQDWARIVVERWRDKMDKLNINSTHALSDSLTANVISGNSGIPERIEFTFKLYGRFVDMGVGAGVRYDDVKILSTDRRIEGRGAGNYRRPRKWYSKPFAYEIKRLNELISKNLGRSVSNILEDNF